MDFFFNAALLGLEYALLAVGVYMTFRILNVPDLTVDGSFALGIAVSAVLTAAGHPWMALLLSLVAGAAAGAVTGFLQTKAGIHPILAGILTMSGLYTVNITIMGGPNVSLLDSKKFFEHIAALFPGMNQEVLKILAALLLCAVAVALQSLFFKTVVGLCIRATGNNEAMVKASSINTAGAKVLAIALANGMVALSGGMLAQYQGFGDINSGSGMIVVGLASVIIGEVIFGRRSVTVGLISAVVGSIVYRLILALALETNLLSANALKLVSAVIVAFTLALPTIRRHVRQYTARKGAERDA